MSQERSFQEQLTPEQLIPEKSIVTSSADQTQIFAALLARYSRPGDVFLLAGGLGAGKTTFVQGFARELGVIGPVTSPTFTLLRQYSCNGTNGIDQLLHADVYRLHTLSEVLDLAVSELLEQESVALVEWGDAVAPLFGQDSLAVRIEQAPAYPDDDCRRITLVANSPSWAERIPKIMSELASLGFCQ